MNLDELIAKRVADAYYGEGAAIGDGTLLNKMIDLFKSLIGDCPLGARRAHRMVTGSRFQKERARRRIWWAAHDMTQDAEQADKMTETAMTVGPMFSETDFVEAAR